MWALDRVTMQSFDEFVESYEDACARGLTLSGESREYFARQRIAHTQRLCSRLTRVGTVVDFGCGAGHAAPLLLEAFPYARAIGIDSSKAAIDAARSRYGDTVMQFLTADQDIPHRSVDVVYSNGTFHHIDPIDRPRQVARIFDCLAPGGVFALWENNPWNPGTRLVMRRIPFDRDAHLLSHRRSVRLLMAGGFHVLGVSFHFYFPRLLRKLRPFERHLEGLPFGAQYCVVAERAR